MNTPARPSSTPARPSGASACPLCTADGGDLVWRDDRLRVVLPDEPDFPGFTRVIWGAHAAEMTDLDPSDRDRLMRTVWAVEAAMRRVLAPRKVNLASLGNMVPHLHWHVVPRWAEDSHFPASPWSAPRAQAAAPGAAQAAAQACRDAARTRLADYRRALVDALGGTGR